ncbi:MAG: hypothetical protein QOH88_681 [Verrucomicrobiota bacterium]|jgi:hypothetical protein
MKITSFLKVTLATPALLFCFATNSSAQILYSQLLSNNKYQLRQVNGDGSGDATIGTPFANVSWPVWSRDAALFAVTATDPNRPNDKGMNVYAINPATGAIQQITNYVDNPPDQTGFYSFHLPYYKAFSPDRGAMAVSRFFVTAGPNGTSQVTPVLEVFSTATPANPLLVHVHRGRANTHHGLEGVDWHPAANLLVTPLEASAPLINDSSHSEPATALFKMDPVDGAVDRGRSQQITFPHADVAADFSYRWSEHDYLPRFSPNGVGVAYVRSIQGFSLNRGTEPDIQSLRILNFNTGAETEVARFNAGFYVTSLDWSPDGGALVFSMGPQENGSSGLQQNAALQAIEIYVINVDGTGFRRLRGAGATAPAWRPNVAQPPPVLGNVATRMRVGNGDNAMIGGFIINGTQAKKVIIRGMGPSLANVGIQGALSNPMLELFQGNTLIATNDNWQQASNTNEIPNGFAPSDGRESIIVTTLAPGTYTAVIRGVGGETGIGVVETYDLSQNANSRLANFSTRGFVETGDNAMIGGFIATNGSSRVMLRAMGPSLRNAGIGNPLQDPTLQLINGNGATVAFNDDWQQAPNTNEIPSGFTPSDQRESVIVTTLSPGNYTAIVRGSGGSIGIALVEAYHLQ